MTGIGKKNKKTRRFATKRRLGDYPDAVSKDHLPKVATGNKTNSHDKENSVNNAIPVKAGDPTALPFSVQRAKI